MVLLGGLHIEMAFCGVIDDFLKGSGWKDIVASLGVSPEGRVDGMQGATQNSRPQWPHKVSTTAFAILQKDAYQSYQETADDTTTVSFQEKTHKKMSMSGVRQWLHDILSSITRI